MRSKLTALFICAALSAGSPLQTEKGIRPQILETGEFHGDEIHARSGQHWLGLFRAQQGYVLRDVEITVQKVRDFLDDGDDGPMTGKEVNVRGSVQPMFLVRRAANLRPGPVKTVLDQDTMLSPQMTLRFSIGGNNYELVVESEKPRQEDIPWPSEAKIVLRTRGTEQVLQTIEAGSYDGFSLRWAGDLDGDGKLDLYLTSGTDSGASSRTLFLSGAASRGRLVEAVAMFYTLGC